MIISATELEVKNFWTFFPFVRHARRSGRQAHSAQGCVKVVVANKDWRTGYTFTAWTDKETMLAFRNSGAHKVAMQQISRVARRYRTITWMADEMPSWKEAKQKLEQLSYRELH